MIVPWSLEPVGDPVVTTVSADEPLELSPDDPDAVAVALVIESPPIRASYEHDPTFGEEGSEIGHHGLLLKPGEHILPIITQNPLRLIAQGTRARISYLWLRRRPDQGGGAAAV